MPFLPYLALRSLLYLAIILLVLSVSNLPVGITRAGIAFSVAMSLGYNLLLGVNDLLGPGVLFAFVAGRYHHPRREERILLFINMRGSTAIAERLGEERFLDFLNRFITDLSLAIAEAGGEIHKYVGDEIIATWTLAAGLNEAACVRACFAALDRRRRAGLPRPPMGWIGRMIGLIMSNREPASPLARNLFAMERPEDIGRLILPPIAPEDYPDSQ